MDLADPCGIYGVRPSALYIMYVAVLVEEFYLMKWLDVGEPVAAEIDRGQCRLGRKVKEARPPNQLKSVPHNECEPNAHTHPDTTHIYFPFQTQRNCHTAKLLSLHERFAFDRRPSIFSKRNTSFHQNQKPFEYPQHNGRVCVCVVNFDLLLKIKMH